MKTTIFFAGLLLFSLNFAAAQSTATPTAKTPAIFGAVTPGTHAALVGKRELGVNIWGYNGPRVLYRKHGATSSKRYIATVRFSRNSLPKTQGGSSTIGEIGGSIGRQKNFCVEKINAYAGIDFGTTISFINNIYYGHYIDNADYSYRRNNTGSAQLSAAPFLGISYPFGKIFSIGAEVRTTADLSISYSSIKEEMKRPNNMITQTRNSWLPNANLFAGSSSATQIFFSVLL